MEFTCDLKVRGKERGGEGEGGEGRGGSEEREGREER